MEDINLIRKEIREHEADFQNVFCTSFDFSDAFIKNEDDLMTLMWDHHQFITKKQDISENNIKEAIGYQMEQGCNYIQRILCQIIFA